MADWGTYPIPCPTCGGEVEWRRLGLDYHGNPGGFSIICKKCKRKFTGAEWESIEKGRREHEEGLDY